MKKTLLIALFIVSIQVSAQNTKFKYSEGMCDFEGQFDPTKVTREQLQNTVDYLWQHTYISTNMTANSYLKPSALSVRALRIECKDKLDELNTLKFVDDPFWNQLKEEIKTFYASTCLLGEFTIVAYSNPDTLMQYPLEDSTCIYYRDVLIKGGQTMIDAWVKYRNDWFDKNGASEEQRKAFDEEMNSPEREYLARIDLMSYGWWNSANHTLPHVESYDFHIEFGRLLKSVKQDCGD